jgi:hypothetical protein
LVDRSLAKVFKDLGEDAKVLSVRFVLLWDYAWIGWQPRDLLLACGREWA